MFKAFFSISATEAHTTKQTSSRAAFVIFAAIIINIHSTTGFPLYYSLQKLIKDLVSCQVLNRFKNNVVTSSGILKKRVNPAELAVAVLQCL